MLILIFWCKIHAICTNIDYILLSIFTAYIYCFAPSEYDNCFTVVCHKHRLLCSKHLLTQDIHHQSDTSSVYFSSPPCSFHLILVWTLRWLLLCKTLVVSVSLLSLTSSDQYNLQQELLLYNKTSFKTLQLETSPSSRSWWHTLHEAWKTPGWTT